MAPRQVTIPRLWALCIVNALFLMTHNPFVRRDSPGSHGQGASSIICAWAATAPEGSEDEGDKTGPLTASELLEKVAEAAHHVQVTADESEAEYEAREEGASAAAGASSQASMSGIIRRLPTDRSIHPPFLYAALETSYVTLHLFARERLLDPNEDTVRRRLPRMRQLPLFRTLVHHFRSIPVIPPNTSEQLPVMDKLLQDLSGTSEAYMLQPQVEAGTGQRLIFLTEQLAQMSTYHLRYILHLVTCSDRFITHRCQFIRLVQLVVPRIIHFILIFNRMRSYFSACTAPSAGLEWRYAGFLAASALLARGVNSLSVILQSIGHGCLLASSGGSFRAYRLALLDYTEGEPLFKAFSAILTPVAPPPPRPPKAQSKVQQRLRQRLQERRRTQKAGGDGTGSGDSDPAEHSARHGVEEKGACGEGDDETAPSRLDATVFMRVIVTHLQKIQLYDKDCKGMLRMLLGEGARASASILLNEYARTPAAAYEESGTAVQIGEEADAEAQKHPATPEECAASPGGDVKESAETTSTGPTGGRGGADARGGASAAGSDSAAGAAASCAAEAADFAGGLRDSCSADTVSGAKDGDGRPEEVASATLSAAGSAGRKGRRRARRHASDVAASTAAAAASPAQSADLSHPDEDVSTPSGSDTHPEKPSSASSSATSATIRRRRRRARGAAPSTASEPGAAATTTAGASAITAAESRDSCSGGSTSGHGGSDSRPDKSASGKDS